MARLIPVVLCATVLAPRAAHADPQVSDVDRQIAAATQRLEALVEQHNAARSDLAGTRARATATTQRIASVSQHVDAARERVGRIAMWAYKTGPTIEIGAVLAAGSPKIFISRLTTIEDLARSDQRKISELTASLRDLAADNASLQKLEVRQVRQESELGALTAQVDNDIAALKTLREQIGAASRRAAPPVTPSPSSISDSQVAPPTPPPSATGAAGKAVAFAYAQLGKPYRWGADGPDSYDCSGLTSAAWQAAGVTLPHNAARQYRAVSHVSRLALRPGDLVFYYRDIHHVAMYVGNDSVVHAPTSGDHVRIQRIDHAPIQGYGRV
jgi:cell wall-associated NlpC family hydrolase